MSPTTTIQAHTAYSAIDPMTPEFSSSDSRRFLDPVRPANDTHRAESGFRTVVIPRDESIANVARSLSLDDFGGRSDAPGG